MIERSTIYEVARRSGVSTATVSRVMREGTGFSEATRDRVLQVARELGWVPNHSARSLAARRAGILGLLFPEIGVRDDIDNDSPLYIDLIIRGAERAASEAGNAILIAATRGRGGLDLAHSVASKVDGLVVLAGSLSSAELSAVARRVPVVLLAGQPRRSRLDFVDADNRAGMHAVTAHLLDVHSYEDVAFVAGPARSPDSRERFAGFRDALAAAGLPVPDRPDAYGAFTGSGGALATAELLDSRRQVPRAIVYGNDEMAIGGLATLRSRGVSVPRQVAVTGFDDIAAARHMHPALTTVRQPMREAGETAVRILLERLTDREAPRRGFVLPTETVIRTSCGCRGRRQPTTEGDR